MFCKDLRKNWRHAGCMWKPTENQICLMCGRPPCLEFCPPSSHTLRINLPLCLQPWDTTELQSQRCFLFCFKLLALLKEVLALMVARKKVLKMETKRSPRQECWCPSTRMWQECSREDCGQIPICQQIPFVTQCFSWEPFCVCLQYPVTKGCPPCNWVVPIQAHHTQAHNLKQHWGHKLDFSCILKRSSESHLKHSGCKLVFR